MQIKKITPFFYKVLILSLPALLLMSCGSAGNAGNNPFSAESSQAADPLAGIDTTGLSEDALADLTYLAGVGPVELTEDGVPTVLVTVSSGMVGDETQSQEDLDARAGENYIRATLGDDYSITYQLTRPQYETMRSVITESLERSLEGMITGKNYNFSAIRHDDHFAVFDVTLTGKRIDVNETLSVLSFYNIAGIYRIFDNDKADTYMVHFYSSEGKLLDTASTKAE